MPVNHRPRKKREIIMRDEIAHADELPVLEEDETEPQKFDVDLIEPPEGRGTLAISNRRIVFLSHHGLMDALRDKPRRPRLEWPIDDSVQAGITRGGGFAGFDALPGQVRVRFADSEELLITTSTANDIVLAITTEGNAEEPSAGEPDDFPGEFVDDEYRNRTLTTAHAYDQFATAIAQAADSGDRSWLVPFVRAFATVARQGGRVLDLGGGSGRESVELTAAGYRVVEFDISRELLKIARARPTVVAAVQGDIAELPFRDAAFDAVWAQASLHHLEVPDVEDALYSIRRVVKPGGAFFSTVQSGESSGWVGPGPGSAVRSNRWYCLVDPDEWREILRDCGFAIHNFEVAPRSPSNNANATGWINVLAIAE